MLHFLRYTLGLILVQLFESLAAVDRRRPPEPLRRLFWDLEWWAMIPKHVCELAALAVLGAGVLCVLLIFVGFLKWLLKK